MKQLFPLFFIIFIASIIEQSFADEIIIDIDNASSRSSSVNIIPIATFVFTYFFYSYCLYRLAKNLGESYTWFAFIPILGIILHLRMAKMSAWWILGLLVPFLNFYIMARMLNSGVSMRTGHGVGWTIGLFFLYCIFLPITAFTYKPASSLN